MAKVISSVTGTRTEPIDSLSFSRGTTASFKMIFTQGGVPTKMDTGNNPIIRLLKPVFLSTNNSPSPQQIGGDIEGTLVAGQDFEYEFQWDVPHDSVPLDNYIVSYYGTVSSMFQNFGDEFFTIAALTGPVGIKPPAYATVSDIRLTKSNIDDYIPKALRKDLTARNDYIEAHLRRATTRLREELSLAKQRGNSENYMLFTAFYTVWSILLSARGEDGSSVSDQNLLFWRAEWERILAQEKRESVFQGLPIGRG